MNPEDEVGTIEWHQKHRRPCCDTIGGFSHEFDCPWYLTHKPEWLEGDFGDSHPDWMAAYKDKKLSVGKTGEAVTVLYLWNGAHGWPSMFRVRRADGRESDYQTDELATFRDYNVPHPTAEQVYQTLRLVDR